MNTFWARPLTNVGTAPAGSGAASDLTEPTGLSAIFGGIGTAEALLAPTTVAMALVVTAVAKTLNLKTLLPSRAFVPAVQRLMVPRKRPIGNVPAPPAC